MKNSLLIIFTIGIIAVSVIPISDAQCLVNEDWPDAPCLDEMINGHYVQKEVNKWADYYQYKGTPFMEQKRSELNNAIQENSLQEWVDQSIQNRNIYEYYFFSGRASNTGEYYGQFDEFMIKESSTIHDPYTDDERYQLANKVSLGDLGVNPQFDVITIIIGISVGFGIAIGMILYWRKRN